MDHFEYLGHRVEQLESGIEKESIIKELRKENAELRSYNDRLVEENSKDYGDIRDERDAAIAELGLHKETEGKDVGSLAAEVVNIKEDYDKLGKNYDSLRSENDHLRHVLNHATIKF
jgi:regulator of replication initiation timing